MNRDAPPPSANDSPYVAPPAVIALDGPGGAGKTVIGRRLARQLGYRFLDTGVMYRAVTLLALRRHIAVQDATALAELAAAMRIDIGQREDGSTSIAVDGEDVTDYLRSAEIDRNVSIVSAVKGVRQAMRSRQRSLAAEGGIVMAGRDIGTVVLPDAPVKIFLTATTHERAQRRQRELAQGGIERPLSEIEAELAERDRRDEEREDSPLVAAADAVCLDTDALSEGEVFERVLQTVRSAL